MLQFEGFPIGQGRAGQGIEPLASSALGEEC